MFQTKQLTCQSYGWKRSETSKKIDVGGEFFESPTLMAFSLNFLFTGVAPPSFLAIQAGQTLNTMASSSDAFSLRSTLLLGVFALLSLTPVIFKKQFKQKLQ